MKKNSLVAIGTLVFFCVFFCVVQGAQTRSPRRADKVAQEEEGRQVGEEESLSIEVPQEEEVDYGQGQTSIFDEEDSFDVNQKRASVINLVERAGLYLKSHKVPQALSVFTHSDEFVQGELYIFVFDPKGTVLAHGKQQDLLWKNFIDLKDTYGTPIVRSIIETAQKGENWITYQWRGSTKVSYVKLIKKGGRSYIIGSGYYPHSKENAVVNLVKGAVGIFNETIKSDIDKQAAFSLISYPIGQFVLGDLYLYALDFKGTIMAQGDRPGLIGLNSWDYKDATGKYVNREIVAKLKDAPEGHGIWVEYVSKGAPKRAYAEEVVDNKGTHYFIACGYYPDANRNAAINLVKRGYQYMKTHGKSIASQEFSDIRKGSFLYGDLFLYVYDMQGNCLAHGGNPDLVGSNQFDEQDEDGRYYIREIIEKAKDNGGWVDVKLNNSFKSLYVERVELGLKEYVIGSGVYPVSKQETVLLLVKSAVGYLRTHDEAEAFSEFVKKGSSFIRGDLGVYVFGTNGICYAYEDDYDLIWKNLMNEKDDDGKPYVKTFINTAKLGSGKVSYKMNDVTKVAYVQQVKKGKKSYIVASGYQL